jgi:hypothetical protein
VKKKNIVNVVLEATLPKLSVPLVKQLLKSPFASSELLMANERKEPKNDRHRRKQEIVDRKIKELVQYYKGKGYTQVEIIHQFNEDLKKYNITMPTLQRTVYKFYEDEE